MKNKIFPFSIFLLIFFTLFQNMSYANPILASSDKLEDCNSTCCPSPKTLQPCNCAYNAPARIDPVCGWKAFINASLIYWQPNEKGIELGQFYNNDSSGNFDKTKLINLNTDYHLGFKVGGGISLNRDDWTIYLEYTRLNSKDSKSVDITKDFVPNINELRTPWFFPNFSNAFKLINATWKLNYNILDLSLGRPYYLGKKLIFKPFISLRSGWIDQEYNLYEVRYDSALAPSTNYFASNKQDSWLIGPRAGLDSDWLIGYSFKFFGKIAGSLTYQNFKVNDFIESPKQSIYPTAKNYTWKSKINNLTPNIEGALGISYGKYFCNNRWYFDLAASYDFHYFWNQNFIRYLYDYNRSALENSDAGNLMLHGLTISLRFDF